MVDAASHWALGGRVAPSPFVSHLDTARAVHAALARCGVGCDVVPPDADLSGYGLVVVPAVDRAPNSLVVAWPSMASEAFELK